MRHDVESIQRLSLGCLAPGEPLWVIDFAWSQSQVMVGVDSPLELRLLLSAFRKLKTLSCDPQRSYDSSSAHDPARYLAEDVAEAVSLSPAQVIHFQALGCHRAHTDLRSAIKSYAGKPTKVSLDH
jgi:hypothetical protein